MLEAWLPPQSHDYSQAGSLHGGLLSAREGSGVKGKLSFIPLAPGKEEISRRRGIPTKKVIDDFRAGKISKYIESIVVVVYTEIQETHI